MPIPDFQSYMLPLLKYAAAQDIEIQIRDTYEE